jgi:hypothetical protein
MSVPTPSGLPPNAMSADSPPEEPPDVSLRLSGLTVRPNMLFTDSACPLSAFPRLFIGYAYDHHGRWHIGLTEAHRPQLLQHVHQRSIVFGRFVDQSREANSTILPFDVEVVFKGDGQPV